MGKGDEWKTVEPLPACLSKQEPALGEFIDSLQCRSWTKQPSGQRTCTRPPERSIELRPQPVLIDSAETAGQIDALTSGSICFGDAVVWRSCDLT